MQIALADWRDAGGAVRSDLRDLRGLRSATADARRTLWRKRPIAHRKALRATGCPVRE